AKQAEVFNPGDVPELLAQGRVHNDSIQMIQHPYGQERIPQVVGRDPLKCILQTLQGSLYILAIVYEGLLDYVQYQHGRVMFRLILIEKEAGAMMVDDDLLGDFPDKGPLIT